MYIFLGTVVWLIVGAGVLAAVDKDGRLLEWAAAGPLGGLGVGVVIALWPIIIIIYLVPREA